MQSRIIRKVFPVVLLALVLSTTLLHAQTFRGGINGTVTDIQGAAIPNAKVEAVNDATAVVHSTSSSSAGEFSFQEIPLGVYTVTATASGFETYVVKKVQVSAGSIYSLPIKLPVASTATTVEVSAQALALDTTTTTQTSVIAGAAVQDAPLNGRDFTQLVVLAPGFANSGAGGFGSLNGTRANQINWQIDGIDNNDLWHNIPAVNQGGVSGIAGIILPIDAVDQFSVQTEASPESGRNPGGSVNLSLKSGTNQLHGTLYYYNRNEALGAIDPFSKAAGLRKQKVRNYNYGFSVGGPFIKDKLFGFATYEHQRFVIGVPNTATEPSQAWQNAATSVIAAKGATLNPVSVKLLSTLWPSKVTGSLPGDAGGAPTANNYVNTDPEYGYSYNGLAKIDYTINDRNSLSAHWFVGQGNQVAPVSSQLLYYYEVAPIHVQNYALVFNHVFSSTVTNQVLAGVNYFNQVFNDLNNGFNMASLGLVTGSTLPGATNIKITGFDPTGQTPPEGRNDITGHLTEDLSLVIGKHQIKLGGEYRKAQLDEFYHRHALGTFTFDGSQGAFPGTAQATPWKSGTARIDALADFLTGEVQNSSIALGDPDRQVFVTTFDIFAQDAFQVSTKLSVNYGLRWDYEGPLHNGWKNLSVFRPGTNNPSAPGIAYQGSEIGNLYDPNYTSFSPRVGASYQASTKTVIRAGVGLYYDTPNLNPFLDNRPGNGAPNGVEGNPGGPNPVTTATAGGYTIQSGVNVFPPGASSNSIFSIAKNFVPPHNMNFNLQIEQSLTDKVIFQLGYVGSEGRHLLSILDINQALPANYQDIKDAEGNTIVSAAQQQQASRPYYSQYPNYSYINEIRSIGTSNYNALQATLRVSNFHRLTAQGAYTWSHNNDDVTAYRGALPQDSTNFKGDYGPSDFDQRNIFVGLLSYEIPGGQRLKPLTNGWQVNTLATFHGGFPFSVFSSADSSGTGDGNQRANLTGVDPYAGFRKAKPTANWLNPAAFVDATPGTWGNSRRNEFYGPGYSSVDFSVFKNTRLTERVSTQFRAEMFNLFNRYNYAPPVNSSQFFNPNTTTDNALGLFTTLGGLNGAPGIGSGEPFNTQLSLKVIF